MGGLQHLLLQLGGLLDQIAALPLALPVRLNRPVVDDNYLGRSTTTILAGSDRRRAGSGGGSTVRVLSQ